MSFPSLQLVPPKVSRFLGWRFLALALLLGAEILVASVFLDGASLVPKHGMLVTAVRTWGSWILRFAIAFAALFATFAYLTRKVEIAAVAAETHNPPVSRLLLALHTLGVAAFVVLSAALFGNRSPRIAPDIFAAGCIVTSAAALVLAALALVPWTFWRRLLRVTGNLWLYTAAASAAACSIGAASRTLWQPASRLTFALVRSLLGLALSDLIVEPGRLRIGTHRFAVIISPECSGLEGVALLLIFGVLWLWMCRKYCRFPQALVLLPASVLVLYLLNALRIAVLILIGHAGAREIATRGFHSQAGWIAFNAVALGFSLAVRRSPWFAMDAGEPAALRENANNPVAPYLVPFLCILAAGMLSRAASAGFEWLYPLRFLAALGSFWIFRRDYRQLVARPGPVAPLIGAVVFVLWIALDALWPHPASDRQIPAVLAAASPGLRILWIAIRASAAIITVPLAEELAFRGFLLRRLIAPEFETVSLRTFTWLSFATSSVVFGLLHGNHWGAGIAAGALYALAAKRAGRLSDAVVAHAVTNALLAIFVLGFARWDLW